MLRSMVLTPDVPVTSPAPLRRQSREVRLRQEFTELYPGIRPGEWMSAALLADRLLADSLLRGSQAAIRGRVLMDTHFDFRGGWSGGGERYGVRFGREM